MIYNSYAKINLFLHVCEKLPNNYHALETCFAFINIYDSLEFQITNYNNISVISKKSIKVNKVFKNTPTIIKNDVSDLSISFNNRKNHYSNVNKSNIMETIKQVNNSESVDELKEKRSLIIIIRSYINTFEK